MINTGMKLCDIRVPARFYQRHRTGLEVLDQALGGDSPGALPGGSYLMTGMPGAGKTTLLIQMVDAFSKMGVRTLLNVGEQSLCMVKMAADRIGISGQFEVQAIREVNELIDHAMQGEFAIVAQDSLPSLRDDEFPNLGREATLQQVAAKLLSLSTTFTMTTFIVNHVTKAGDMRGSLTLAHDADAHMHLSLSKESGNRIVELKKNRFGPAAIPYEFTMSSRGLDLRKLVGGEEPTARSNDRRDILFGTIRSLLLAGHKLSGYSHEEERELIELHISGGAMRAALRLVAKGLQAEGARVITAIINRREHTYVDTTPATT